MKLIFCALVALPFLSLAQQLPVKLRPIELDKKVEVYIGDELFTAYWYPSADVLKKPVLYPVISPQGNHIERGWPFNPRDNERVDHPHHVGIWFNAGDVNGNDFWNNSNDVDQSKHHYGTIISTGIVKAKSGMKSGTLVATANWIGHDGKLLLHETTTFTFSGTAEARVIDRKTTLEAVEKVDFVDNKEGMFAIRLARELEHASETSGLFTDANGVQTKMQSLDNALVTGQYINDAGVTGADVWSKRSTYMNLTGKLANENVSVAMFDHPANHNYPAHWHARGYGLYAVNNIGSTVFSDGKEPASDFTLQVGEKTTFQYRMVVASKTLSADELKAIAVGFGKK